MANKKKQFERIVDQSQTLPRVDFKELEGALEVNPAAGADDWHGGSPFSLIALRSRLMTELVSTGGRKGRKEAIVRKKVPLTETEWNVLDQITELLRGRGLNATSGQVAGILLHQSMMEVLHRIQKVTPLRDLKSNAAKRVSDIELEKTVEEILTAAASAEAHLEQLRPVALELLRRMRQGKGTENDG